MLVAAPAFPNAETVVPDPDRGPAWHPTYRFTVTAEMCRAIRESPLPALHTNPSVGVGLKPTCPARPNAIIVIPTLFFVIPTEVEESKTVIIHPPLQIGSTL